MTEHPDPSLIFDVFTEIGILEQLSRARLEAHLPRGLIAPHFAVVNHLMRRGDGATPVMMARAFQVPKTSMTHTLQGLEKGGFVALRPNPKDGRSKQVWLTDKGRNLVGDTVQRLAPDFMHMLDGFDLDKLLAIKPILSELRLLMDAARD